MTAQDEAGPLPRRGARPPYVIITVTPGPANLAGWVCERLRASAASLSSAAGFLGLEIWQYAHATPDGKMIVSCLTRWASQAHYARWRSGEPAQEASRQTQEDLRYALLSSPYLYQPPEDWDGPEAGGYRLVTSLDAGGAWHDEPDAEG